MVSISNCSRYLNFCQKEWLNFQLLPSVVISENSNSSIQQVKLCRCLDVQCATNSLWQARQEIMLFSIKCSTGTLLDFFYGWVAKLMIPALKIFQVKLMYTGLCPSTIARKTSPMQFWRFVCAFRDLKWRQRCFLRENSGFGSGILQSIFSQSREFWAVFSLLNRMSGLSPTCLMYKIYICCISNIKS